MFVRFIHQIIRQSWTGDGDCPTAQGKAVAELITSLVSTPNAMIQAGSLLVMKIDGEIIVRNLTQSELLHLERNPALLRAPTAALHELQSLNVPAAELAQPSG